MTHEHDHHDHHDHEHDDDHDHELDEHYEPEARYGHLRANVHKRRTGYKWILALGFLTLAATVVDILFLDNALQLPLLAVYGVLALAAILMYFSRSIKEPKEEEPEEEAFPVDANINLRERTGTSYDLADVRHGVLSCPSCRQVFQLGLEHYDQRRNVLFTCPECGEAGRLPTDAKPPVVADIPVEPVHAAWYHCDHCGEDWSVGTFGHDGRVSRFEACPHCGTKDEIMVRRLVDA